MNTQNPDWKPQFIYFDLDDTLLDHKKAEQKSLDDVYHHFRDPLQKHSLDQIKSIYHDINVGLWKQYGAGEITKEVLRIKRFEAWLDALRATSLSANEVGTFYIERYHQHWDYIGGAATAFQKIADQYPVGILTNGFAEIQHAKLAQFPELKKKSHAVVISEEVGYLKPHPALFSHATQKANVAASDILYVGDSYHSDVEGSLRAGWTPAWYTAARPEEDVFCFSDWDHLLDALDL